MTPDDTAEAAETCRATAVFMDTVVAIEVVHRDGRGADDCARLVGAAFARFGEVGARCTRFAPGSELMRLCAAGVAGWVRVSPLLFRALDCALAVAAASDGAFDPTVGRVLAARGFDEHYRTGARSAAGRNVAPGATYRDVHLDPARRAATLGAPLVLDLGAVAKGLAIDLAAEALQPLADFAIDAGGDVYVSGRDAYGELWPVGLRDPRRAGAVFDVWRASDAAICTSGDYERRRPGGGGHHIVVPHSGRSPVGAVAVTVAASSAMVADALATAALVLGPDAGIDLLERWEVDGIIVTPDLGQRATHRVRAGRGDVGSGGRRDGREDEALSAARSEAA